MSIGHVLKTMKNCIKLVFMFLRFFAQIEHFFLDFLNRLFSKWMMGALSSRRGEERMEECGGTRTHDC